jgi:hypothetical protein
LRIRTRALGVRILPELACRCSNSGYSGVPAVTPEFRSLYCDRQTGHCGRSGLPGSGPVCSQLNLKYKLLSFIVKVQVAKAHGATPRSLPRAATACSRMAWTGAADFRRLRLTAPPTTSSHSAPPQREPVRVPVTQLSPTAVTGITAVTEAGQ